MAVAASVVAAPREVGSMDKRPNWLKPYLKSDDLKQIEAAVAQAELTTSGEVVPMVVRKSSTVGHVPLLLLALFSLLFFAIDLDHYQMVWIPLPHWLLIILDVCILFLLVRVLAPLPFIERLLTPKGDQQEQVEQRALTEFYNIRVHHTKKSTGILIFVSLMERRAVVLGDEAIAQKLAPETWDKLLQELVGSIQSRELANGFSKAVIDCGKLLSEHFPKPQDDTNQLQNHLVIKE